MPDCESIGVLIQRVSIAHHDGCIRNVFGRNGRESVHFPNAMVPRLVVSSKVLNVDGICAEKNVNQYL